MLGPPRQQTQHVKVKLLEEARSAEMRGWFEEAGRVPSTNAFSLPPGPLPRIGTSHPGPGPV